MPFWSSRVGLGASFPSPDLRPPGEGLASGPVTQTGDGVRVVAADICDARVAGRSLEGASERCALLLDERGDEFHRERAAESVRGDSVAGAAQASAGSLGAPVNACQLAARGSGPFRFGLRAGHIERECQTECKCNHGDLRRSVAAVAWSHGTSLHFRSFLHLRPRPSRRALRSVFTNTAISRTLSAAGRSRAWWSESR